MGKMQVTWIEHSEYDESAVHYLYRSLLSSGLGFGALRWLATLQRQCESIAILLSSTVPCEDHPGLFLDLLPHHVFISLAKMAIYMIR